MIKKALINLLRFPIQKFYNFKTINALSQITSHKYLKLKAVGDALYETLTHTFSAEEYNWIRLIEQRRSFLLNSEKEIEVIDYGAGSAGSNRTKKEMEKGVQSKARVSNICKVSKSTFWATFLFKLIRKLKSLFCVELGSCVGISASYMAAALALNGKGKLFTLEGSPESAKIAEETLKKLNLQNGSVITGPFHKTLNGVLKSAMPVDFFFNDGHHDHDAVIQYTNDALPYLSDEAIIIFDDISWSPGMRKAWTEIENNNQVAVSIDLQIMGIVFVKNNSVKKEKIRIPVYKYAK